MNAAEKRTARTKLTAEVRRLKNEMRDELTDHQDCTASCRVPDRVWFNLGMIDSYLDRIDTIA